MKYKVPIEIIVEAGNELEAYYEVQSFLDRSTMEWRTTYQIKDFSIQKHLIDEEGWDSDALKKILIT